MSVTGIIIFTEPMMQVFNVQEKSDWIIYNRYIQRDLELCKLLIDQELRNTKDNNEFAFYILVKMLIHRLHFLFIVIFLKKLNNKQGNIS